MNDDSLNGLDHFLFPPRWVIFTIIIFLRKFILDLIFWIRIILQGMLTRKIKEMLSFSWLITV